MGFTVSRQVHSRCEATAGRELKPKTPDLCSQGVHQIHSREQEDGMWEGGECISLEKIGSGEYLERDEVSWQGLRSVSMSYLASRKENRAWLKKAELKSSVQSGETVSF